MGLLRIDKTWNEPVYLYYFIASMILWCLTTPSFCETPAIITTVAGNGINGYSGDGATATSAQIYRPFAVTLDNSGNIYIADNWNNRVRKINAATGIINTVAGNGTQGFSGDGSIATSAQLNEPSGLAVDNNGNIYIAERYNHRIRKVDVASGNIITIAGNGTSGFSGDDGMAVNASLNTPRGIALDNRGNLYIADSNNHRIRKVDVGNGKISTVAGSASGGYNGDGMTATSARLYNPLGVALDSSSNLYIADTNNNRIRKVDVVTGKISTVAGNGTRAYGSDGIAAINSPLAEPGGVILDSSGNLYIADTYTYRIRKVDAISGNIITVAGNGVAGYNGDDVAATNAQLNVAIAVGLDGSGNIYIADSMNHRIRRVALIQGLSQPNLTISPLLMPLDKNQAQTLTFTVTNAANAAAAATLGTPTFSGYHAGQFTVNTAASNDCSNATLSAGASCTVSVSYTPDPNQSLPNTVAGLNIQNSVGIIHAQALISSGESDNSQAARRLPDVLTSINIPSLAVGNPATITWTMTGYQTDAHSQIALFECATDGAGAVSTCGDTYASRTAASEVLSPTTTADGDWTYLGVRAKNRTYSYTYTPTKAGPVVLRFYQKSGIDKAANNTGTSLLIPGGLNGAGSSFTYFDAEGRRIKATVQ